jgi:hypothetical protein
MYSGVPNTRCGSEQVGQALSTRPDLMPQTYLDELTELQDALPCFSDQVRTRMTRLTFTLQHMGAC